MVKTRYNTSDTHDVKKCRIKVLVYGTRNIIGNDASETFPI